MKPAVDQITQQDEPRQAKSCLWSLYRQVLHRREHGRLLYQEKTHSNGTPRQKDAGGVNVYDLLVKLLKTRLWHVRQDEHNRQIKGSTGHRKRAILSKNATRLQPDSRTNFRPSNRAERKYRFLWGVGPKVWFNAAQSRYSDYFFL